ncbi:ComF family protein [Glutamicibacter protophormiae]|uniref:ComF family protein n=1 Tax=Glutamicibacter protophormiae TaxID=37930 RepID=UPI00195AE31E|nr:phosphoribosyltransferase family protein [Glutamicibacter protophormiae]QRQ77458.1 ComF family protein [Glutamicibacter protophormiae]WPR63444.1 phosphoribosyltransferase family protein [Glutamicibacter protophormiae]WPR66940.1 phosphoribosyltransferase family protein [Glutamicibacter protophormiae]
MGSNDREFLRDLDQLYGQKTPQWLRFALRETVNFLLPASCAVCGRADDRLCAACRSAVRHQLGLPPLPASLNRYLELPALAGQIPVAACGIYGNELARAILAYKDHQRYFLKNLFAPYLAAALNAALVPQTSARRTLIVPMPTSLKAVARRGYRPVESMLQSAERLGLLDAGLELSPVLHYRLGQVFSGAQKSKSGADRRGRRVQLIAEIPRVRQQPILLVDDVMTTGATLQNAAITCNNAGFEVLGAVVLALTRPPGDEGPGQLR